MLVVPVHKGTVAYSQPIRWMDVLDECRFAWTISIMLACYFAWTIQPLFAEYIDMAANRRHASTGFSDG